MPDDDKDLNTLAAEIAKQGAAGDPVTVVLAKGVTDALGKFGELAAMLVGMNKGKGPPPKDGDGDGKVDADGDGDDDDDAPGYQDMDKGTRGKLDVPASAPASGDALDVSKFVFETAAAVSELVKARNADHAEVVEIRKCLAAVQAQNKELGEQNRQLGAMIAKSSEATMSAVVPLAKAVADSREAMLDIPASAITPRLGGGPRLGSKPSAPDAAFIGGTKVIETRVLAKALNTGTIDAATKQRFFHGRRFHADDAANAATRAKLEALVPSVT